MSIHSDPRQYGTDEERAEWKRDLEYEYRGESISRRMPKAFIVVPAVYGAVPSPPDPPECEGEFDWEKCKGCSEYEECEREWEDEG